MILIEGQDEAVREWMSQQLGMPLSDGRAFGFWNEKEKRLAGGVSFTNYTGFGIEMTLAGSGCVSRSAWQFIGDFVFRRMGCVRLVITTQRMNKKRGNPVAKMARKFGFKFEGVARRYYGDRDGIQWSLLKEEAIQLGHYKEAT